MFKKGVSGNPEGRKKGTGNKLPSIFMRCLEFTFNELQGDPKSNMLSWARDNTTDFYKLVAKLMPKELEITATETKKITWNFNVLPASGDLPLPELPNTEHTLNLDEIEILPEIKDISSTGDGFGTDTM